MLKDFFGFYFIEFQNKNWVDQKQNITNWIERPLYQ